MDKKRSKPSGAQFRKKRKEEEEEKHAKDKGALLKYFGAPSGTGQDEEPSTSSATQVSSQMLSEDEDPFASTSPQHDSSEMPVAASPPNLAAEDEPLSTDPADWPSVLTDRIQTQLVCRGPSEVTPNFVFPRNVGD
uniref:Uncharacterized protein n=1 Tax=Hucho hucho TaxID=62062 RepID=A0A4W5L0X3_9TELE